MNDNRKQGSPITNSSNALIHDELAFFQIIDLFPLPIEIFYPNGLSAFVNRAFTEFFGFSDVDKIVGRLNVLEDTYINHELCLAEFIKRVFKGEILTCTDIKVPFDEIQSRFDKDADKKPPNSVYQDIISFPVWSESGSIAFIVAVFKTRKVYQEQHDVFKVKTLIEQRCTEEFDIEFLANAVGLSRHYIIRMFKKHTGLTPHSYYQNMKVERIKEALRNKEQSIAKAFASCGADYSGSFAKIFRERAGMTPSEYRRTVKPKSIKQGAHTAKAAKEAHTPSTAPTLPSEYESMIFHVADIFPIPIQIFKSDGELVLINEAVLKMWNIADPLQIIGKYNLITDHFVNEESGLKPYISRVFQGEVVIIPDIRVPLESFWAWYDKGTEVYDIEALYTDILNFPLMGEDGTVSYIISVFFTSRIYKGSPDIARAKEYMENHWLEEFDSDKISEAVHLSRFHFTRLFKKHTGITPYSYYQQLKVRHLREALRDKNLTVAGAFAACGIPYHGNYAKLFRERTGMTPSQYRKSVDEAANKA